MARIANFSADEVDDGVTPSTATSTRRRQPRVSMKSLSPSPAASFSSDKENLRAQADPSRHNTSKTRNMPPPQLPSPSSADLETPRSTKRRKLGERDAPNASQTVHERKLAETGDKRFYDPDQSIDERRAVRKDFRHLSRELTGTPPIHLVERAVIDLLP